MSIVTKKGDSGTCGLMYNRRVSKCHPRVEACGAMDELNAAVGLARATADRDFVRDPLRLIQKDLVVVMGELATLLEDRSRYAADGYALVDFSMTERLEALIETIESQNISFQGWATPGDTFHSGALEVARTACRRAERRVVALHDSQQLTNPEILIYLNRLSDALWLLARWVETESQKSANA
jgi:cob(I)alamin adenosyltransferase